ncbi:hypothetical protein AGJ34_02570 [Cronobacter dublinensis subsp. dublinensis]|nr:hypothetical protein [Cronobacter dublinensis subsp. dublinensis]EGT5668710.1 hypothetical protein [Cronobacter dublinensis subsp. dublinensis]EGT5671915.1 hypothetical protein [Cronobacter dublinensis subsp. dublinensis]EGT5676520.1 hypothetical protein [Cronobacter dublinensis subsp. dublinensis]EGT5684936.1 hypothetical protein [Cronobacter dublinensis subsp. dublinensis]
MHKTQTAWQPGIPQVRQIYRLIATGVSLTETRSFPDCMLLVAGTTFRPLTQPGQYQRLKKLKAQISEPEQRKARLVRRCARTAIPTRLNNRTIPHGNKLCAGCNDNPA